jgi:hypothetical protein
LLRARQKKEATQFKPGGDAKRNVSAGPKKLVNMKSNSPAKRDTKAGPELFKSGFAARSLTNG